MNGPLWRPAYIGVGSNLDDPANQVREGARRIAEIPETLVVLTSPLYRSAPMGPQDQPDFVNCVVAILTQREPLELLVALQSAEDGQGRVRSAKRWGPRTLDLDLLAYSTVKMATASLTLPHPGIAERNFVLLPWADVAPHYRVPGLATVRQLAGAVVANVPKIEKL